MYDGRICAYLHPSVALAPEEAYTVFVNSLKSGKHMHPYDHYTILYSTGRTIFIIVSGWLSSMLFLLLFVLFLVVNKN